MCEMIIFSVLIIVTSQVAHVWSYPFVLLLSLDFPGGSQAGSYNAVEFPSNGNEARSVCVAVVLATSPISKREGMTSVSGFESPTHTPTHYTFAWPFLPQELVNHHSLTGTWVELSPKCLMIYIIVYIQFSWYFKWPVTTRMCLGNPLRDSVQP